LLARWSLKARGAPVGLAFQNLAITPPNSRAIQLRSAL
jgi:hypothetical protein